MRISDYSKKSYYLFIFTSVVLLGFLLKILSAVITPVIIAVIFSCIFYPIVKKMYEKLKFPWILGTIIMALFVLIVIFLLSTIIGKSLTTLLNQYPKYEDKFLSLYKLFAETFNVTFYDDKSFVQNIWSQFKVREIVQKLAVSFSGNLISFAKTLTVIILFMVFLLIEMRYGKNKIEAMFQEKLQGRVRNMLKAIVNDIVHFLSIKFFISLATGGLVYLCCLCVGLDFAILWAVLAFIMNFIPTFGSIISVVITTVFATLQFYPGIFKIVFVFLFMLAINFILGNIVEPRIEGKDLGISPFVILVSLTFWGWMWGFIGMIIAVPLMVVVKIICENVEYLHPFAILIGNNPDDTVKELYHDDESSSDEIK